MDPIAIAPDNSLIDLSKIIKIGPLEAEDTNNVANLNAKIEIWWDTQKGVSLSTLRIMDYEPIDGGTDLHAAKEECLEIYQNRRRSFEMAWRRYKTWEATQKTQKNG